MPRKCKKSENLKSRHRKNEASVCQYSGTEVGVESTFILERGGPGTDHLRDAKSDMDKVDRLMADVSMEESEDSSNNSSYNEPDWYLKISCLNEANTARVPGWAKNLSNVGLGNKDILVENYKTVSEDAFIMMINKEYPLLEQEGGGFDLFYCKLLMKLSPVLEPWTPTNVYAQVRGSSRRVYIRPRQTIQVDMSLVIGYDGPDSSDSGKDSTRESRKKRQAEMIQQTHLKKLEFSNPGSKSKFLEDFDPERSGREMRKMKRKIYCESKSRKSCMYDEHGLLIRDQRDMCDCCQRSCPGCHYPCPKCKSPKCGLECRNNRKYVYSTVEVEGTNRTYQFVDTGDSYR